MAGNRSLKSSELRGSVIGGFTATAALFAIGSSEALDLIQYHALAATEVSARYLKDAHFQEHTEVTELIRRCKV